MMNRRGGVNGGGEKLREEKKKNQPPVFVYLRNSVSDNLELRLGLVPQCWVPSARSWGL